MKTVRTQRIFLGLDLSPELKNKFAKPPYPIHIKNMGQKLAGLKIKPPQESFWVKEISLFESKLSHEGSTYKILKTWPLTHQSY